MSAGGLGVAWRKGPTNSRRPSRHRLPPPAGTQTTRCYRINNRRGGANTTATTETQAKTITEIAPMRKAA